MDPGPWIAVVGPNDATPRELELAESVGAAVADAQATLVCGGLGGVMAAACRGAFQHGGLTVGLLPGEERQAANEWVEVSLPTGLGEARNVLLVRAADALVAVGGGWGTLSEIALALRAGLPVIGLETWTPMREGTRGPGVLVRHDPGAAVEEALRRAGWGAET